MANYKTGAQRYNDRMDKVFSEAKEKKAEHEKGESKAREKKEHLARKMKYSKMMESKEGRKAFFKEREKSGEPAYKRP